jgi:ribosomal protein S18 acetylase RimI-like enzyme
MMPIRIAKADLASPLHAKALVQLLDEYASSFEGGGQGLAEEVKGRLPREIATRPHAHAWIAWSNDEPAGLIVAFEGFSTFLAKPLLNIHDVIVSAAHRGCGLSNGLLQAVEEFPREIGCCKLTLEVMEGNAIAQRAYASAGFSGYQLDPTLGRALFWEKKL